jgi:thiol-disulfide isomerase/thioredoxin
MKLSRLIPLLSACLIFAACAQASPSFLDAKGHKIDVTTWKDKWIIINYWAGWCESCVSEIAQLNSFYRGHAKEVVLVGVNYDDMSGDNLLSAIKTMDIQFPVLQTNPAKTLGLPAVNVLPTTFIINPKGELAQQLYGPQTQKGLEEMVNVDN